MAKPVIPKMSFSDCLFPPLLLENRGARIWFEFMVVQSAINYLG